ncbi:type II toxin-antitoxin system VapC family toxin [Sulfitobacter mediterraneus]|uniref:type II toxin-antitoxin system VapC family toxin n=1 Tax=Sulfitobacter mediterraneus TaxID=83219 RepID=UPI000EA3018C|nr:PIN domain-containing protein [Sulfitobacter mediterraneus]
MIFVDTNVLLDVVTDDENFAEWSIAQLETAALRGDLLINDSVYAELSVGYREKERLDAFIEAAGLRHEMIPRDALFLAGKAFSAYRRAKGTKQNVLPDFFIGAHATVLSVPLLTRDARRYRTYFPALDVISPE